MIAAAWRCRAEEDPVRHLRLGAADLLQQVVGLVDGEEGVRQDEQDAACEGPGKVGARTRIQIEVGELPNRPGRPVRGVQAPIGGLGGTLAEVGAGQPGFPAWTAIRDRGRRLTRPDWSAFAIFSSYRSVPRPCTYSAW